MSYPSLTQTLHNLVTSCPAQLVNSEAHNAACRMIFDIECGAFVSLLDVGKVAVQLLQAIEASI